MSARPDSPELREQIARFGRRITWIALVRGAARGLAVALLIALAVSAIRGQANLAVDSVLAASGALAGTLVALRRPRRVAALVEQQAPQCRNLVLTADELMRGRPRTSPTIARRVLLEADSVLSRLEPRLLFPARRALGGLGASSVAWAGALVWIALQGAQPIGRPIGVVRPSTARIDEVDILVTPPSYSGKPETSLHDPAHIEALQGSRIRVGVRGQFASLTMETLAGRQPLHAEPGAFTAELRADADGFIAFEPVAANGHAGVRHLIGLTVVPDAAPRVRVTAPGHDLFLNDAKRTIDIALESDDDIALRTLEVRYTKASGSGEQIKFTDGTLPLALERTDARHWKGRASLRLAALGLQPGDLIVYHGVASDQRPGAPGSQSDSYIVEINAPGSSAAEGFSADDEDKYALSQEMLVLETQKLIARAPTMAAESLAYETLRLAALQRSVRAEFVFMMGGEVAEEVLSAANVTELDEQAEAQREGDLAAGRLRNRGTTALIQAIRAMSRANRALSEQNLAQGLIDEKAAVAALQRAFAHTRFILRALVQRERLDPARRLSGDLSTAANSTAPLLLPLLDASTIVLRSALATLTSIAESETNASTAAHLSEIATVVLRQNPANKSLQQIASALNDAAIAIDVGRFNDAHALIDRAGQQLTATLRNQLAPAAAARRAAELNRLEGALADQQRAGRSR